jgi:two-component system alkaline phosphatase synthesis response regulator PhoP
MQTILVVDDEPALRDVITYNLRQAGYETVESGDGREALDLAAQARPALVILDLMLPGLDGLTVYRILRERHRALPVIMVTARTSEMDRVLGLELGADDYVSKPFSPRELVARVRAVLRRTAGPAAEGAEVTAPAPFPVRPEASETIDLGRGLLFRRRAREVLRNGKTAGLTPTELRLLEVMLEREGETLSRQQLFHLAWGQDAYGDERTVDVHIRHLREKLESDPSRPELLRTVRGFGYRLTRPHEAEVED